MVASRTNPDLAWTVEKLAAKNQERYDSIERWRQEKMAEGKMSLAQIAKGASDKRRAMLTEQMEEFRVAVWSDNANVSEELKIVIRWGEKYLETHKNFYRFRAKMTTNMSTSAEWTLRMAFLAEHVLYLYSHHSFFPLALLQHLNAYDAGMNVVALAFHVHTDRIRKLYLSQTGPPGAGKSVLLNKVKSALIDGTVLTFTYETLKVCNGRNIDLITSRRLNQELRPSRMENARSTTLLCRFMKKVMTAWELE